MDIGNEKVFFESDLLGRGVDRILNDHPIAHFTPPAIDRLVGGVKPRLVITSAEPGAGIPHASADALKAATDSVLFLSVKGKGDERLENMRNQVRPVALAALKNHYGTTGAADLMFDTRFATFREA